MTNLLYDYIQYSHDLHCFLDFIYIYIYILFYLEHLRSTEVCLFVCLFVWFFLAFQLDFLQFEYILSENKRRKTRGRFLMDDQNMKYVDQKVKKRLTDE